MDFFETFVLMPSGLKNEYGGGVIESDYIFKEIIEPGVIGAAKLIYPQLKDNEELLQREFRSKITREIDRKQTGLITSTIINSIAKADVVVVDITGRNPNVFFELGIRYAIRSKVTVLMAQEGTQIPFDINRYKYIEYNHFKPAEARELISETICLGMSGSVTSDSIVFDILPSMTVTIPNIATSYGLEAVKRRDMMTWDEYLSRIEETSSYLEAAYKDCKFIPDAVMGITNGGLIAADLIGKRVYAGSNIPVLSLWAKRYEVKAQPAYWYFDNEYNNATMESIQKVKGQEAINILLIDDHMGTGSTARQAVAYIKTILGDDVVVVYIPLVSRRLDNIGVVEEFLPHSFLDKEGKPRFNISRDQFLKEVTTESLYFPYLKKQVNVSSSG